MSPARRLVIGDGLAGLAAASRAEGAGAEVTLVRAGAESAAGHSRLELAPRFRPALDSLATAVDQTTGRLDEVSVTSAIEIRGGRVHPVELQKDGLLGVGQARALLDTWRGPRLSSLAHWFAPLLSSPHLGASSRLDDRSLDDFNRVYVGRRLAARALAGVASVAFGLDPKDASRLAGFRWLDPDGRLALSALRGVGALETRLQKQLRDVRALRALHVGRGLRGHRVELDDGSSLEADATILAGTAAECLALLPDASPLESKVLGGATRTTRTCVEVSASAADAAQICWVPRSEGGLLSGGLRVSTSRWLLTPRPGCALDPPDVASGLLREARAAGDAWLTQLEDPEARSESRASFDVGQLARNSRLLTEAEARFGERPVLFAGDWLRGADVESTVASGLWAADRTLNAL